MTETVRRLRRALALGFVGLLGFGFASPLLFAQQRVGVNSAVNPDAMGIPPGGLPKRLVLGQDVVFNERITTEAKGQTQVLFVDESTLSIGPNANMVIDQFVYDPNSGAGKLAASLTRGVFRFVGGKISKLDNAVTLQTPSATIGIRGGVMLVRVRTGCGSGASPLGAGGCDALQVVFVYGKGVTITGLNGVTQTIFRPGFQVTVAKPGASPSDPSPAPPGDTAEMLAQLDGRAGGNGGAPQVPTEVTVATSGIANVISANLQASIQAAAKTQPLRPQPQDVIPFVTQTELNNQNVQVTGARATPVGGGATVAFNRFLSKPTTQGAPIPSATMPTTSQIPVMNLATVTPSPPPTPVVITPTTPAVITPTTPVIPGPTSPNPPVSTIPTRPSQTMINPPALPVINTPTPPAINPPIPPVINPPILPVMNTPTPPAINPPPPPPVVNPTPATPVNLVGIAGGYFDTGNKGTASGFAGSLAPYAGANSVNGLFSATLSPGNTISFPLVTGTATLDPTGTGTSSPLGPVTGATYVAPDNSFFYANLTPVNQPSQREFIYGGAPVNSSFYKATASTPSYLAFNVQPDAALQSSIPFIRLPAGGSLGSSAKVSPLILATPLNATFSNSFGGTKALQASLAVVGTGSGQQSVIVVLVGNVFDASLNGTSAAQPILNGIIHGSYLANAAGQPIRIYSPFVTPADRNGTGFYGSKSISGFVASNGNCCAPGELASQAFETNTANQAIANYQFAQPATAATSVPQAVSGGTQTTRALSGYFGGIMAKEPNPGSTASPVPYVLAGTATINTNASNQQVAANLNGSDPFAAASKSGIQSVNLGYGSINTGATNARIAFINDKYFAVLENPETPSTVNGVTVPVNDTNTGSNIYLVTQTAAPPPSSLLQNGLCSSCQYLQWGYWGGQLDTPASGQNSARTDVGHINFWVAGTPATSMADISSLKASNFSGTYNGNLIGTVVNSGTQYLASGGLQATYFFGTGNGSFSVKNYDGNSFTEPLSGTITGPNYSFGIKHVSGVSGAVSGSFYGPMARETAGNFAFTTGPTYSTSGVFAAQR